MRCLISSDKSGQRTYLTDEAADSSWGMPVLEITGEVIDGTFGPSDLIGDPARPETLRTAADIVLAWALSPNRSKAEVDIARRFLRQWPAGPQIAADVR